MQERALEDARRRLREMGLRRGQAVFLLVEGDSKLWGARIVRQVRPPRGPEVDVFLAEWASMFLTLESMRDAYRVTDAGVRLEVRVGVTGYVLEPLPPEG